MTKRVGFLGSFLLGTTMVAGGLVADLALAGNQQGNQNQNQQGNQNQNGISVPEPASWILLGAGLIGVGLYRRMSQKE